MGKNMESQKMVKLKKIGENAEKKKSKLISLEILTKKS